MHYGILFLQGVHCSLMSELLAGDVGRAGTCASSVVAVLEADGLSIVLEPGFRHVDEVGVRPAVLALLELDAAVADTDRVPRQPVVRTGEVVRGVVEPPRLELDDVELLLLRARSSAGGEPSDGEHGDEHRGGNARHGKTLQLGVHGGYDSTTCAICQV